MTRCSQEAHHQETCCGAWGAHEGSKALHQPNRRHFSQANQLYKTHSTLPCTCHGFLARPLIKDRAAAGKQWLKYVVCGQIRGGRKGGTNNGTATNHSSSSVLCWGQSTGPVAQMLRPKQKHRNNG